MSDFQQPIGFCPACEEEGAKQHATFSKNQTEITCPRGHLFSDIGDFGNGITKEERKKINKLTRQKKTVSEKSEAGTVQSPAAKPEKVEVSYSKDILINEIDKARIASLVGEFQDASTLTGMIFAMKAELDELKESKDKARKLIMTVDPKEDGKIVESGDMTFIAIIPERHVEPIRDLATNWSATITRYMNERMETLLDDMMFY